MERKFVNGEHWYLIRDITDPNLPHRFEISSSTSSDWSPWYIHDKWDDMEKWLLSRGYTGDFTYQPGTVHIQVHRWDPASKILDSQVYTSVLGRCQHEWATYTGFIKVEVYCTKCKEVQRENKG